MPRGSAIVSSSSSLPEASLTGYAMVGTDIIIGDAGRRSYGDVAPNHDGAYVTVTRGVRTATIGTDEVGYGRLFLYEADHHWAVGASLVDLAEYVHEQGWPLHGDDDQLQTFLLTGTISNQLVSNRTAFREIRVLPGGATVVVKGRLRRNTFELRMPEPTAPWRSYSGLLMEAIEQATGRVRTLIDHGMPLVADITGGRDSRSVLGVLLAGNPTERPIGEVIRFRSDHRRAEDLAVAEALSAKYGLQVNTGSAGRREHVDPQHGFEVWRRHDLGVYGPIYPFHSFTRELPISGAGGESHRLFYKRPTMADVIRRAGARVPERTLRTLEASMEADLDALTEEGGDPRITHYRAFRDRFHGGRNPLRQMTFAPLASASLRRASLLMPAERRENAQVLVDVLLNTRRELADEPYDSPEKAITAQQRYDATTYFRRTPAAGTLHGDLPVPKLVGEPGSSLAPFAEALEDAAGRVRSAGLLPVETVDAAESVMRDAVPSDRFGHAADGQVVSAVVLAGEVARLTEVSSLRARMTVPA